MKVLLSRGSSINSEFWQTTAIRIAFIGVLIVFWQFIFILISRRADPTIAVLFPSPWQVWESLVKGFSQGGN
ncbi:MAG: hypothetical protein ABI210_12250, partial [Abditibacteriaceae bacterium]